MVQALKFVWPKDGPKRRGRRGFRGRLADILTGTGPDIFLQREESRDPIMRDQWQNWDSYRNFGAHQQEQAGFRSRGFKRYDPHSRKFVKWSHPHDWYGIGIDGNGVGRDGAEYPRFTENECIKMRRLRLKGRPIDSRSMGSDWSRLGPKRWHSEHDEFWRNAHRQAENLHQSLPQFGGLNPNLCMRQKDRLDLKPWLETSGITSS